MKKISSLVAVLALAAVGLFTTSCSDNDNPVPTPKVVEDVTVDQTFVLQVTSNVTAKFTFDGKIQKGKDVTFETNKLTGVLTIEADGYVTEYHEVTFSDENTFNKIATTMVKPSSVEVAQAIVKGTTVKNDPLNKLAIGVDAAVSVPVDVNITGNTTDPFSVVVYKPKTDIIPEVYTNQVVSNSISGLLCEPDGAIFDKPLTVTVTIPDAEGCEFEGEEGPAIVDGDNVSVKVSHFSRVPLFMKARVLSVVPGTEVYTIPLRISKGINKFKYAMKTGFDSKVPVGAKRYFLESTHGAFGSVNREAKFEVDNDGSATIQVIQHYTDITYQSGTQIFTARTYLGVSASVVSTSADTTPAIHSGGSN